MDYPDRRLKKKYQENRSCYGCSSRCTPVLQRTQTKCQALKRTHHVLEPVMRGASFMETKHHPLERPHPALEWTMREIRILIWKPLPNFSQNTILSLTCSTSMAAQIKAYILPSSLNSRSPLSHPKPRDQLRDCFFSKALSSWCAEVQVFGVLFATLRSRFILKRHLRWLAQAQWRCTASSRQDQTSP